MRREEFPVGRPDWENVIIEEGLTYSVDGPHDTDHYWNEYAAYIFSPQEMDSVRAQAEEMHRMCLETVEYIASGAFGTLGLPRRHSTSRLNPGTAATPTSTAASTSPTLVCPATP